MAMNAYRLEVTTYWGDSLLDVVSSQIVSSQVQLQVPRGARVMGAREPGRSLRLAPALTYILAVGQQLTYEVGELRVTSRYVADEPKPLRTSADWGWLRVFVICGLLHVLLIAAFFFAPDEVLELNPGDVAPWHRYSHFGGFGLKAPSHFTSEPPVALDYNLDDIPTPASRAELLRMIEDAPLARAFNLRADTKPRRPSSLSLLVPLGRGRILPTKVTVGRPFERRDIARVLRRNRRRFSRCYDDSLGLHAEISNNPRLSFTIRVDGRVKHAAVDGATVASKVTRCTLRVLRTLRFRERAWGAPVIASFVFGYHCSRALPYYP